jgi:SNF2 family DNA or RNA helicase
MLWDYQKQAVEFVGEVSKGYLAMGLGTGKTITALSAGVQYSKKGGILVIAEKNEVVNSQNFMRESENFDGWNYYNLRDTMIGNWGLNEKVICGINPDALDKVDIPALTILFDVLVVDESTMAKNTSTARFKAIKRVADVMSHVILLSGTPMMNGASELYAPLLLLGHPLAGEGRVKDREAFENIFCSVYTIPNRNAKVKWLKIRVVKDAKYIRELRLLLEDQFYFLRKEEAGVFKKKNRRVKQIPMTVPWLIEYQQAWDEYMATLNVREFDTEKKKATFLKNVKQLKNLIENGKVYQVNSKWKARQVVEDIKKGEYGDKRIVIFSLFIETDDYICELLTEACIKHRRFDDVREFKTGDEQVLVGRIKAHGKGGNVPEASVVIMVDMDFVPANNIQAENRIDRPEQKNEMDVVYYITEGEDVVDAHVREINREKNKAINEFMRPFAPGERDRVHESLAKLKREHYKNFNTLGYL